MISPVLKSIVHYKNRQLQRFLAQAPRAREVQHRSLLEKIHRQADSEFGRQHGFGAMHDVASFRRRMPIASYEDFRPYIDRVMRGDTQAMFTPETRLLMFAITSGTTSEPKHIPVTDTFYKEYRTGWQLWGTAVFRDYPVLLNRHVLQLTSDWRLRTSESGIPCGNISGLAAATRPFYMKLLFFMPPTVTKIRNYEAKYYTTLRLSLARRKVACLITANPSTLVEFARRADQHAESLVRDIFDGRLSQEVEVPEHLRESLQPRLRPNRSRARELEAMRSRHGHLYPKDFWPQLELLAVWTGGSVGAYLPQLAEYYGDLPIRDHGISASEGRMTIPLTDGTPDGILDFAHHYFEFIPEDEYGSPQPTVLEAHELEPDKNYFILLTTSAGLYRYDIHDMLRCVGFEGQAPVLRFLNKGKHFSSMTGEKLSEHQVALAVTNSLKELSLPTCTFTVAPNSNSKPCYELLLEPGPQLSRGPQLCQLVQQQLSAINIEYSDKCASGRLGAIVPRAVAPGTWAAWRAARSRERGNFEEFKQPLLVPDPDFADKLPTPTPAVVSDQRSADQHPSDVRDQHEAPIVNSSEQARV